jgi:uncharacterized protein (TIGR03067 family)
VGDDLARLQGRWRQVAGEADGVTSIGDEYGAVGALVTTFTGTHFVVHHDDGRVVLEGDFEIDPSAHTIDWIDSIGPDAGKRLPAIYRLDGDTFVFVAADGERPRSFTTTAGQVLRSFVRLK